MHHGTPTHSSTESIHQEFGWGEIRDALIKVYCLVAFSQLRNFIPVGERKKKNPNQLVAAVPKEDHCAPTGRQLHNKQGWEGTRARGDKSLRVQKKNNKRKIKLLFAFSIFSSSMSVTRLNLQLVSNGPALDLKGTTRFCSCILFAGKLHG